MNNNDTITNEPIKPIQFEITQRTQEDGGSYFPWTKVHDVVYTYGTLLPGIMYNTQRHVPGTSIRMNCWKNFECNATQ